MPTTPSPAMITALRFYAGQLDYCPKGIKASTAALRRRELITPPATTTGPTYDLTDAGHAVLAAADDNPATALAIRGDACRVDPTGRFIATAPAGVGPFASVCWHALAVVPDGLRGDRDALTAAGHAVTTPCKSAFYDGPIEERLIVIDGNKVGGTYWCGSDSIPAGSEWASYGPAGLSMGWPTRMQAEAAQFAAWRRIETETRETETETTETETETATPVSPVYPPFARVWVSVSETETAETETACGDPRHRDSETAKAETETGTGTVVSTFTRRSRDSQTRDRWYMVSMDLSANTLAFPAHRLTRSASPLRDCFRDLAANPVIFEVTRRGPSGWGPDWCGLTAAGGYDPATLNGLASRIAARRARELGGGEVRVAVTVPDGRYAYVVQGDLVASGLAA